MAKKNKAIISGSIDIEAIDKTKLNKGKNGKTYLNITLMVQDQSQYGNNCWVTQSQTKAEQDAKVPAVTLGNAAVKWVSPDGITVAEKTEITNSEQNRDREISTPY